MFMLRLRRLFTAGLALITTAVLLANIMAVPAYANFYAANPAVYAGALGDEPERDSRQPDLSSVVEDRLLDELAREERASFWIVLDEQADLSAASSMDWSSRGKYVYSQLIETASRSQAGVAAFLDSQNIRYKSFWIANAIYVPSGNMDLVADLAAMATVSEIVADKVTPLTELHFGIDEQRLAQVEWGVVDIGADRVWDDLGIRGEGIVIGSIGSGAMLTHEALVDQYRGNLGDGTFDHHYNWMDYTNQCGLPSFGPCDNHGRDTHTLGTAVGSDGGDNQIGVAPGARWIAAKGCQTDRCAATSLLQSMEFMLAPTDLHGENADTDMRPHIVNNSWGMATGRQAIDTRYQEAVQAWTAAGIFPVFANGDSGPCGIVEEPALFPESYAVGNHTSAHGISLWSAPGPAPAPYEVVKPNITAPGTNIRSAWNDGEYSVLSSTAAAAPHVSGAVALIWSGNEGLIGDIDATRELLDNTAIPMTDLKCGGDPEFNNVWGRGRMDAYAAVEMAVAMGTLTGVITEAAGPGASLLDEPIAGVSITAVEKDSALVWETESRADGTYELLLPAGTYDIHFEAFGYELKTEPDVTIEEDKTTELSVGLFPSPTGVVSGTVVSRGDDEALAATITALNTPLEPVETDPGSGQFQMTLPLGTYTLRVRAEGHLLQDEVITVGAGGAVADFALKPLKVLLVDGQGGYSGYDSTHFYHTVLDALGVEYDEVVISVRGDGAPDAGEMAEYDVILWFTGGDGRPGPYPGDQEELAAYLEGGGSLLLTSMQYFHGQEANDFSFTYLGIEDHVRSSQSAKITGVASHPVGGEFQETMQLVYPFGSFSGTVHAADHAEVAFTGDKAAPGIAVTVDGRIYRTAFNFFPWETIFGLENRLQVMAKYLDWLTDKDVGTIQGTVTDAETGDPVEGGTVFITDQFDGKVFEAVTDADGFYSRELPEGTFDAVFTGYGYEDGAAADIIIGAGAATTVDAQLEHAARVVISGVVSDADTGEGVAATVHVLDAPVPPAETDPVTGEYEIEVALGDYTLEARADGYLPLQQDAHAGGDITVDFALKEFAVSVLLVDNQNEESYDALPIYEEALQVLNVEYEHYLVPRGASGPPLAKLLEWDVVVWFSGASFLWAGPKENDEAALTQYLEAGGSLLLVSQEYIDRRGLNPFSQGYLGVDSYSGSSRSVEVTGAEGHPVGGQFLDALDLVFPPDFTNRSDTIRPTPGARVAFTGDRAADGIALTFNGGVYKTAFLAFPWELIDDAEARNEIMLEFLDWLRTKPIGAISGQVTDAETGEGVAGVAVAMTDGDGAVFEDVTDEEGYYGRSVPIGTFDVAFTLYGYEDHVTPGVVVAEGDDVKVDVELEKSPTAIISGTVASSETGEGLAATVSVLDAPVDPVATDPATGEYEIEVVLGEYTVEARAEGHLPDKAPADASADVTVDFHLDPFDVTVLLVDDQGFSSRDSLPYYEDILDELNVTYEVFPVPYGSSGPSADDMAPWDVVVWFTGEESYGVGPAGGDEAALMEYLGGGGSVLLSSQGYLMTEGKNDFNEEYFGVGDYDMWTFSYIVSGVEGHPVTGNYTDPMELDFSMYIETGSVTAAPHAETAFTGDRAPDGIAVTVDKGLYKTAFLGFPWEGITDEENRFGIMRDFLRWLSDRSGLGTVTGTVTDYNDGEGVAGATVRALVDGEAAYETTTDADGGYQLMMPLGDYTVEATAEHYGAESQEVSLEDEGEETEADFTLKTGVARAEPDALEFELIEGTAGSGTFTLTNEGSRSMGWHIETEYRMRPDPAAAATLTLSRNPHYDALAPTASGMYDDAEPAFAPAAVGDVLKSWPSGLNIPWGVGFDGDVIISNPAGGGGDDHNHKFTVDGEFITKWSTAAWQGEWAADIAYDVNNDLLWQVAVGGDNCLYGLNPDSGQQREKICGSPWADEAQRGVAYRADDDTFYVAGWVENIIYHIRGLSHDSPGEVISQRNYSPGGRGLSGLTWNGDAGVLWVATNSPDDNIYGLEPDNGWLEVAVVGHPDPGFNGGGLSMDEEGNLWMVSQGSRTVYLVDSGIEAIPPPPWLTAGPEEGRLDPDEGETITVSVDTDGMRLGTYSGSVIINSESGRRPSFAVPVTLTVLMGDHGWVKGRVTNMNDKEPVAGAVVRALADGKVIDQTFTEEDGTYELQLRLGEYTIEAEAENYGTASDTVNIGEHGEEYTVHLALPTAAGKLDPEALEFSVEEGHSETKTITLINTGTRDMKWSIAKRKVRTGGFGSSDLSIHTVGLVKDPSFDADAVTAEGMYLNGSPAAVPAARGDVLKSWPINLDEPWGVGFDDGVILSNPNTGSGGDNHNHKFTEDGEFITKWSTADWQGTWTADMAYDDRHDLVWQVNVGGDNCIQGMDPVKGALVDTICGFPWSNVSQRGLAYRSDDDTFYVGGWNENIIYRIAGLSHLQPGAVIDKYDDFTAGGISGLAWNDTAKVLWVATNSADDNMYALTPDDGWAQIAVVGHPEGGGFNAAGLSINDDGHLWLISQNSHTAYLVDSGIPHSGGLNWLQVDPGEGIVPAGQSVTVEVTVNASGVEPGTHRAALLVANDSGRPTDLTVEITAEVLMGPSAVVEGVVEDGNGEGPISGARVEAVDAEGNFIKSVRTGGDGSYKLQLNLGEYSIIASAINYESETFALHMASEGAVYEKDFVLATGRGEVDPGALEFTVPAGGSAVGAATLSNTGGADLTWSARGMAAGGINISGREDVPLGLVKAAGFDTNAQSARGMFADTSAAAPAPAGQVLKSWPTDLSGPWGVGYDGHVIISDLTISGGDHKFTTDGEHVAWWPTSSWEGTWAADMAYDRNHNLLWQVNVGGDNCLYGLDPADGEPLENICGSAWTGTSQRGVAYRADNDTLYVGGWNGNIIYHIKGLSYDNPGEVLDQLAFSPGGRGISGLAWNEAARVLWVATNSADDNLYALAPDEGWRIITEIGHPEGGDFNGAGLSIDEAGNLWMVSQSSKLAYLVDGGIPGWLEADPHGGILEAGGTETVDVLVRAIGLQPGTYEAELRISTDGGRDPRELAVTVKLHVLDADAGPHLVVTEPEDGGHTNADFITVAGSAIDAGGGPVTVTVNGQNAPVGDDGSFSFVELLPEEEGPYEITVVAIGDGDKSATETRTITVDRTDPVIDLDSIEPSEDVELSPGETLIIGFTGEPGLSAGYMVLAAGGLSSGVPGTPIEEVDDGVYEAVYTAPSDAQFENAVIEINVADKAGNMITVQAPGRLSVVPGHTPPIVVITEPDEGFLTNRDGVLVSGTVADEQGIAGVTVDGRAVEVGDDGSFSGRALLDEGANVISVTATNTVGLETTETVTVIADWTAPELENIMPDEDVVLEWGEELEIGFTSEPGLTAAYQMIVSGVTSDGGAILVRGVPFDEVDPGVYRASYTAPAASFSGAEIQINAKDAAGNKTHEVAPGRVTVVPPADPVSPPQLVIIEPEDGLITNRSAVRVSGIATDDQPGQTVEGVTVNGRSVEVGDDGGFAIRLVLTEGANVIAVAATNTAGETAVETVTVTADWTPPELENMEPSEHIALEQGESYTVRFTSEPGLTAAFQVIIGGQRGKWHGKDLPVRGTSMVEVDPGVYEGVYTAPAGAAFAEAIVQFNAADEGGNVTMVTAPGSISVVRR